MHLTHPLAELLLAGHPNWIILHSSVVSLIRHLLLRHRYHTHPSNALRNLDKDKAWRRLLLNFSYLVVHLLWAVQDNKQPLYGETSTSRAPIPHGQPDIPMVT